MATLLCPSYNPEVFQAVPLFEDAVAQMQTFDLSSILGQIGQIFVKHDVTQKYGLMVVHRHFIFKILVDSSNSEGTLNVAVPWIVNGTKVEQPVDAEYYNQFPLVRENFIRPQTWIFGQDGKLMAFEFEFCGADGDVEPPTEFVTELYAKLKELGAESVFGFSLHHEDNWETPILEKRANIHFFNQYDEEPVEEGREVVYWTFNQEGGFFGEGVGKGSCVSGVDKGSCVSGGMGKGSCVSGMDKGSCVSGGMGKGSCVSGVDKGSCVSGGMGKGSCVSGVDKGSCVSGGMGKGSCVSGVDKGSCVSERMGKGNSGFCADKK